MVNPEFLANFLGAPHFSRTASASRAVHFDIFRHQLAEVFVGGHHVYFKPFFLGFLGHKANHVICFESFLSDGRNVHPLQQLENPGHRAFDVFWGFVPIGLVIRVLLISE